MATGDFPKDYKATWTPTPTQIKTMVRLTAAAEVGLLRELKSFGHAGPDGPNEDEAAIRHTAAAEIGEPTYDDWVGRAAQMEAERDARITKREHDDALDDIRQATIERCAQVADERGTNEGNKIADRIRALKDKPAKETQK